MEVKITKSNRDGATWYSFNPPLAYWLFRAGADAIILEKKVDAGRQQLHRLDHTAFSDLVREESPSSEEPAMPELQLFWECFPNADSPRARMMRVLAGEAGLPGRQFLVNSLGTAALLLDRRDPDFLGVLAAINGDTEPLPDTYAACLESTQAVWEQVELTT